MLGTNSKTSFLRSGAGTAATVAMILIASGAAADEVEPQTLIDQAPQWSTEKSRRHYALDGSVEWPEYGKLLLQVRSSPKLFSLTLRSAADHTPLLIVQDDRALLYNPAEARILLLHGARTEFRYHQTDDDPAWDLQIKPSDRATTTPVLEIDLKSVFSVENSQTKVEPAAEGKFLLISMPTPQLLHAASVDQGSAQPFVHYECSVTDRKEPWVVLDKLETPEAYEAAFPAMPDIERLKERIEVVEYPAGSWSHYLFWQTQYSWNYRRALTDLGQRKKASAVFGYIEWEKAKKRDAEASAALREVIYGAGPATEERQQSPSTAPTEPTTNSADD